MFIIGRSVTVRDDEVAPNAPHQSQVAESLHHEVVLEWLIYKFNNLTYLVGIFSIICQDIIFHSFNLLKKSFMYYYFRYHISQQLEA